MLRLTGGEFRGRMIKTPSGTNTRPTQARLRQALLNSLQASIPGSRVLDLFAGSGALGFEALSRGAEFVAFVETSKPALALLNQNAKELKVMERVKVLGDSVEKSARALETLGPFDVIFADPPYAEGWETKLLETFPWEKLLAPDGMFCLEWGMQKSQVKELPDNTPFLVKVREKNYGDSVLTTYQRPNE